VKSSKLRRLKKVGTSQRVESSDDVENVFNQGRNIVDMDQDEGIELVVDHEKDAEVVAASTPIPAAKPKILKIAAAPAVSTRRRKRVVIRDPEEELHTYTPELDKEHEEAYKQNDWNVSLDHVQSKEPRFDANMKFLFKSREEMEKEDEEIIKSINETPV
nr:hypothetical protein [Tanacetum cinerariifolium]